MQTFTSISRALSTLLCVVRFHHLAPWTCHMSVLPCFEFLKVFLVFYGVSVCFVFYVWAELPEIKLLMMMMMMINLLTRLWSFFLCARAVCYMGCYLLVPVRCELCFHNDSSMRTALFQRWRGIITVA